MLAGMYGKFPLQAIEPILMQKKKDGLVLVTDQKNGRSDGKMQHLVNTDNYRQCTVYMYIRMYNCCVLSSYVSNLKFNLKICN